MITLITGCMGSEKTARLIELADQGPAENRLVLTNKKEEPNKNLPSLHPFSE